MACSAARLGLWLVTLVTLLCTLEVTASMETVTGFYADNGLEQSVIVDTLPQRRRKEIRQEILTLLGLHDKPKQHTPDTKNSAPQYMLDLYRLLENEQENVVEDLNNHQFFHIGSALPLIHLQNSDMVMSFLNRASKKHGIVDDRDKRYFFDFSEVSPAESVIGSALRVYKRRKRRVKDREPFHFQLYQLERREEDDSVLNLLYTEVVDSNYEGWFSFNTTAAAANWTTFQASNLGLYMKILDKDGEEIEPHEVGLVGRKGPEEQQPFMVAFFNTEQQLHVRNTRAARRRKSSSESPEVTLKDDPNVFFRRGSRLSCQRRLLYVEFKDLGWQDWIIAPNGYAAYFCEGECSFPLNAHMNATNHAIVQTLVHLMSPRKVPKAFCAPTKLSAISVLYFDDNNNVVLKKYKNMVVGACGCH